MVRTLLGPIESDVELSHAIINEVDLIVGHQPIYHLRVSLYVDQSV